MAEEKEEPKEETKDTVEPEEEKKVAEKVEPKSAKKGEKPAFDKEGWKPRTSLGRKVKNGEIKDIDEILDNGFKIMEAEIVDILLPNVETDLLLIGQSKGKFGGGQRRVFKQTQKKTQEGNKPKFATFAIAGNHDGYIGIGYGKSKETVPAREKAIRNAKLNIIKIRRGCGSWECGCKDAHSIPFKIEGKCGSVRIKIMPAPKGTGLCVEPECQKILGLAGVKDVWSKTLGQTGTKINVIYACIMALKNLIATKTQSRFMENLGICEGRLEK
ncbi:30S ribosomal protein S5 [Candidatus Woesearchaeota archaeon]|nr:30S ribosomal protein S5 [Candidatus Woesearchaeota archaeon]